MKSLVRKVGLILALTVLAAWLRLPSLGEVNLYNDEYYQFEAAVGWLKKGEWVRWDYYTATADKPYDRAKLFMVQVAGSIALFGETEWAARLPAALWGILLIPLTVLLLLRISKHELMAYGTGLVLAVDPLSIELSRYVRMYSMLMVCSIGIVFLFYRCLESRRWARLWYGGGALVVTIIAVLIFKELTLALLAALAVYVTVRTVLFLVQRQPVDRPWVVAWISGAVLGSVAIVLTILGYNVIPLDAAIIRDQPHWSYVVDLFSAWRVPAIAAGFAVIGVAVSGRQLRSFSGLSAVAALVILIYFTFFSHRWDAQRYVSIVVPLISFITVIGLIVTLRFLFELLPKPTWLRYGLIIPLALLAGPTGSFNQPVYPDLRTAYRFVADQAAPGEVVLIQGPRFYYWPDPTLPVYKLGAYKSLTLPEFKALAKRGTSGGWVIYATDHQRHLRDNIKHYVTKRFDQVTELRDTGVKVYHFVPDDVK